MHMLYDCTKEILIEIDLFFILKKLIISLRFRNINKEANMFTVHISEYPYPGIYCMMYQYQVTKNIQKALDSFQDISII